MRILISGATGLIGSHLTPALARDHELVRLARPQSKRGADSVIYDPENQSIEREKLSGFEAVIHLAGENVDSGRWTEERKRRLRDSRVVGTSLLARALTEQPAPPRIFLCASAVGFYGNRGDEVLSESSAPGGDFLAETSVAWEAACEPLRQVGTRVVNMRIGMVLSREGGALKRMLPIFKLGVAGRLGSGRQWISWIAIDDVVGAMLHCLNRDIAGPVNFCSPNPVRNAEFTQALARAVHRPAVLPAPAFALRLALGEIADSLLLSSIRMVPQRLQETGFAFRYPQLDAALNAELRR